MPNYYYFIALGGLCSYITHMFARNFNGSKVQFGYMMTNVSGLGYLSYLALIIVMFFKVTWWHPVLLVVSITVVSVILSPLAKSLIAVMLSAIGVVVFNILAWTAIF